jgi:hypothetical protein
LFLFGSGLSLLYAVAGAYSIRWLLMERLGLALAVDGLIVAASFGLLRWA